MDEAATMHISSCRLSVAAFQNHRIIFNAYGPCEERNCIFKARVFREGHGYLAPIGQAKACMLGGNRLRRLSLKAALAWRNDLRDFARLPV